MVKPGKNLLSVTGLTAPGLFAARPGEMVFDSLTPPTPLCKRGAKTQGFPLGGMSWVFTRLSAARDGEMVFHSLTPPTPLCKRGAKNKPSGWGEVIRFFPPDSHRSAWENAFGDFAKIQMPNGRGSPIRPSLVLSPTWQRGVWGVNRLFLYL